MRMYDFYGMFLGLLLALDTIFPIIFSEVWYDHYYLDITRLLRSITSGVQLWEYL
jgi:hypothetical protein